MEQNADFDGVFPGNQCTQHTSQRKHECANRSRWRAEPCGRTDFVLHDVLLVARGSIVIAARANNSEPTRLVESLDLVASGGEGLVTSQEE